MIEHPVDLFPELGFDRSEIVPADCPEHIHFVLYSHELGSSLYINFLRLYALECFINPCLHIARQDIVRTQAPSALSHDVLDLLITESLCFQISPFEKCHIYRPFFRPDEAA